MSGKAWPTELTFDRSARALAIAFDDGAQFSIPFELLRVESPSAEVRGHGAGPKTFEAGKACVGVVEAMPVGRYAVRIVFDDGHGTGIYTWDFLRRLGEERDERFADYVAWIAARGLSRGIA